MNGELQWTKFSGVIPSVSPAPPRIIVKPYKTDVLRKAQAIDSAGIETEIKTQAEEKKTFYDTELTPEIRLSYEDLLKEVLPPYAPGTTASSIAFTYYDRFDALKYWTS